MSMSFPMGRNQDRPMANPMVGNPPTLDPATVAFMAAAGISSATIGNAVNNLVLTLKNAGVWRRCVAIYPMVGGSGAAHKFNLVNPADTDFAKRLSFAGSWTHSATGALPDGSTAYADTFINANEDVPQYSFCGSYYSGSNAAPVGDRDLFGLNGGGNSSIRLEFTSTSVIYASFDASKTVQLNSETVFKGFYVMSGYNFDKFNLYRDGASIGSNTNVRYSYNPDAQVERRRTLYLAATNTGAAGQFCPYECRFASFGFGLSSTQVAALSAAVASFQSALGRAA